MTNQFNGIPSAQRTLLASDRDCAPHQLLPSTQRNILARDIPGYSVRTKKKDTITVAYLKNKQDAQSFKDILRAQLSKVSDRLEQVGLTIDAKTDPDYGPFRIDIKVPSTFPLDLFEKALTAATEIAINTKMFRGNERIFVPMEQPPFQGSRMPSLLAKATPQLTR